MTFNLQKRSEGIEVFMYIGISSTDLILSWSGSDVVDTPFEVKANVASRFSTTKGAAKVCLELEHLHSERG
jgi:hypothetical protein